MARKVIEAGPEGVELDDVSSSLAPGPDDHGPWRCHLCEREFVRTWMGINSHLLRHRLPEGERWAALNKALPRMAEKITRNLERENVRADRLQKKAREVKHE